MAEPDGAQPRNSKLAGASLICGLLALPAASIGWAARGSDSDWLWPYAIGAAALLSLSSVFCAVAAIIVITNSHQRLKGMGYAVAALVLNVAGIAWLALQAVVAMRAVR